jgi:shikimate kinase
VEARAGMKVAEIFERRGEAAFRLLEAETIRDVAGCERTVLALGGGALESPATREFLQSLPRVRVVFLDAPFDTLVSRCAGRPDAPVRPVLRDREGLAARWQARQPLYREAHRTVATADRAPADVADWIVQELFGGKAAEALCAASSEGNGAGDRG